MVEEEDEDVEVELVEPFDTLDDLRCLDDDDDVAEEEFPWGSDSRLLDFIPLLPLPPILLALPGCCCVGEGSSSFSGDDGPSLELVSWLIGLYGGIVLTLPPFFNLL